MEGGRGYSMEGGRGYSMEGGMGYSMEGGMGYSMEGQMAETPSLCVFLPCLLCRRPPAAVC